MSIPVDRDIFGRTHFIRTRIMGSYVSCHACSDGSCLASGRVVLPGGAVHHFDRQVAAAELMLEHPQHFVVEYRSASSGKLYPLPADHKLDVGRVYVMVPTATAISVEEARRLVFMSRWRKKGRELAAEATEERSESSEKVGVVEWSVGKFGERPEAFSRQYSSKGWKPSLGTIEERTLERKVSHWLFPQDT